MTSESKRESLYCTVLQSDAVFDTLSGRIFFTRVFPNTQILVASEIMIPGKETLPHPSPPPPTHTHTERYGSQMLFCEPTPES
jgi:hypothetical protein